MKPEKHLLFSNGKDGTLIRNYYCTDCHCGPFLLKDIRKNILVEIGGERQRFYYCRKCYNLKFSPKVPVIPSEEDKIREEYILSGKALEDLLADSTLLRDPPKSVYINLGIKPIGKDDKITTVVAEKSQALKDVKDKAPKVEKVVEPVKVPVVAEKPKDIPNLEALSGKQIIDLVKEKTGQIITISVKSKKSIIKHALKLLGAPEKHEQKPAVVVETVKELNSAVIEGVVKEFAAKDPTITNEVNLDLLSGRQIIDLVKEKTGHIITTSTKSKKLIIKQALKLLSDSNVCVPGSN